jgi:hypothetical protein
LCLRQPPVQRGDQRVGQPGQDFPSGKSQGRAQPRFRADRDGLREHDLCFARRMNGRRFRHYHRQFDGCDSAYRAGIYASLTLCASRLVKNGKAIAQVKRPG